MSLVRYQQITSFVGATATSKKPGHHARCRIAESLDWPRSTLRGLHLAGLHRSILYHGHVPVCQNIYVRAEMSRAAATPSHSSHTPPRPPSCSVLCPKAEAPVSHGVSCYLLHSPLSCPSFVVFLPRNLPLYFMCLLLCRVYPQPRPVRES